MESLLIILKLHTPEELILYSNIAHWVEGAVLLMAAGIVLLQIFGYLRDKLYLWPSLILLSGLFFPIFSYGHHLDELGLAWQATIYDPQQRQHMLMAALMSIAGFSELVRIRYRQSAWRFVWPAVLATVGILFLVHPQHGTGEAVMQAALIHTYLGSVLVLAGTFRVAEMLWPNVKWLAYPWIVFLALAGILLVSYREPEGAYIAESPSTGQIQREMAH